MSNARQTEILEGFREDSTGFLAQITSDHAYIHRGYGFSAIVNTGSISAAYDIAFTTPIESEKIEVHFRPSLITSSAEYVTATLYEGDSFSGGTAVTPVNLERTSGNTSKMQTFVKGATVTPAGTVLKSFGIGSASGGGSGGDIAGSEHELVLKPNTSYVFTLDPDAATTCILNLYWYEEPVA